uniref:Uncharacterized protein n=1 Tax=Anguilla anguilla TaxID=7936 RepID=A0A0E9UNW2_ANGAN
MVKRYIFAGGFIFDRLGPTVSPESRVPSFEPGEKLRLISADD